MAQPSCNIFDLVDRIIEKLADPETLQDLEHLQIVLGGGVNERVLADTNTPEKRALHSFVTRKRGTGAL